MGEPADLLIQAGEGGRFTVSVGQWDAERTEVIFGQAREMSEEEVGRMKDAFRDVLLVQTLSWGEACPPTGAVQLFRWDDFEVSAVTCRPSGSLLKIDTDSAERVRDLLVDLAG